MIENEAFQLVVDGKPIACVAGQTVAGALLAGGLYRFRASPLAGAPRGPFCMMGACQECAIEIDGVIRRACQTEAAPGMVVALRGAGGAA
ncbi:(2Fe-2S)-binding protein [Marinovum sp.]|uniref:(2Fe-2S)-binding protein n=1 Tax=Marinovum sp. TaxID=2024839 RepID=UPI002B265E50|nr:(2Fe-2S)-binding protein [Marinovum sp.]